MTTGRDLPNIAASGSRLEAAACGGEDRPPNLSLRGEACIGQCHTNAGARADEAWAPGALLPGTVFSRLPAGRAWGRDRFGRGGRGSGCNTSRTGAALRPIEPRFMLGLTNALLSLPVMPQRARASARPGGGQVLGRALGQGSPPPGLTEARDRRHAGAIDNGDSAPTRQKKRAGVPARWAVKASAQAPR